MPNILPKMFSMLTHFASAVALFGAAKYEMLPAFIPMAITLQAGTNITVGLLIDHEQEDRYSNLSRLAHMFAHLGSGAASYLVTSYYEMTDDYSISSKATIIAMLPSFIFHGIGFLLDSLSKLGKDKPQKKEGIFTMCKASLYGLMGGALVLALIDYAEHKYKLFLPAAVNLFEVLFPSKINNFDELFELATKSEPQQPSSVAASSGNVETQLLSKSSNSLFQQSGRRRHRSRTSEQKQEKENRKDKRHEVRELNPPTILVKSGYESAPQMRFSCAML